MKTFRNLLLATLVIIAGASTSAFAGNSDKTENRNVKNFNEIKVSTGIDLYITMGNEEKVTVVADDEIIDDLITEVKDGTLHIYMKRNNRWFNWGSFNEPRKAYVTVKELQKIDASSGSDVRSENTLTGEELKIEASSGSDVEVEVVYKNLSLNTSSGSDAKITGKAKYFDADASSGSDIDARGLESEKCRVSASSGSDAVVNVSEELVARASSGGDVVYYGNPKTKDTDESSGGDVTQR